MLIVLEGVDSSGKATHTEGVYNRLLKEGKRVQKISFPDYESPSSALVKMYLDGSFGENPSDVSPYAASCFYAVDRFASFKTKWGEFLNSGGIIIADRYVTSNMIHQAAKLETSKEKDVFLDWIYDLEYKKLNLPVPDKVIFLDMPPKFAIKLMEDRKNKFTGEAKKDIHERDVTHLEKAYENALYVASKYNWSTVKCATDNLRSIEDIQSDIMSIIGL